MGGTAGTCTAASISWRTWSRTSARPAGGGQALLHAEEGYELAREAGSLVFQAILAADRALVEAHLGEEAAARRHAAEAIDLDDHLEPPLAERTAAWALGILELSLGGYGKASDHLGPLVESRWSAGVAEPGDMRFVPDLIEALIGSGQLVDAQRMLDRFDELARASGRIHALAACDRCRGLLLAAQGVPDAAIEALEASRSRYATIDDPFGSARTSLALGTVERHRLHKRAARDALETAVASFEALGARPWTKRANAELGRIGGRAPSRDALTPGEQQVASLVAEGRTNREVAGSLSVTERTIEGHLSNIYAKLGVRSRADRRTRDRGVPGAANKDERKGNRRRSPKPVMRKKVGVGEEGVRWRQMRFTLCGHGAQRAVEHPGGAGDRCGRH